MCVDDYPVLPKIPPGDITCSLFGCFFVLFFFTRVFRWPCVFSISFIPFHPPLLRLERLRGWNLICLLLSYFDARTRYRLFRFP
ncbi:uncharacterized protein BO97DRAFT_284636 [Aspergillus homomorphus CBS 101889]|uniref:Uncharacterized protein n=1 Tax=Aspergillus homomorphus (strain CBS 101889) TaxID=1450537 RepID=A0A395I2L0_ASPHC|nr:hypothetical protein BO97DRAFT_284636 [Aspergillus homomorphus CBS 101889]RAL14411.1 hypothetical protein BO97DRAFT_284636 [Aspergillus homomorphus CBS 101889]